MDILESLKAVQVELKRNKEEIAALSENQRKIKHKMNKIIKHINNKYIVRYSSSDSDICYDSN